MKITFAILVACCSFSAYSQNLVPNPGFEEYVTPPCSWMGTPTDLAGAMEDWHMLSGSPDIFNTLVPPSCFASCSSVENYSVGQQQPHSGDFMAGIITYGAGMGSQSQYRESYEIQLTSPLVVGQLYYAEMYVSLADYAEYASNNIGMYFSEPHIGFNINVWTPMHYTPQVIETAIVDNTTGWVKISGTFVADTPAGYLLIANFADDSLTDVYHLSSTGALADAYYFIDDILVKETCLSVGSNKTICQNESATITASSPSFNGWALESDPATILSTDSVFSVSPSVTTTYLAFADCDTFSVTVVVETAPPALFLGNDTTFCEGKTLVLQAAGVNGSYVWQDGSDQPYYDVTTAGTYSLTETNQCGTTFSDIEVNISPLPVIDFGNVTWLCEGDSILLYEMDPTLEAHYTDMAGNFITLTVIKDPGMYYLVAHNDCGYSSKILFVEGVPCAPGQGIAEEAVIEMPNVVTPNDDQLNDLFTPVKLTGIVTMKTTLFNRWGEVIYETTDPAIQWNGAPYTEGVYFWKIEYTDQYLQTKEQHGFFHLVK